MHFHSLLPVEITTVTEDTETDLQIATAIAFLEVLLQRSKRNIVAQIQLERLKRLRNSFSRAVDEAVVTAMLPYDENSEDPKYQEFEDHTDRLKHEYENEKVNCIKMPDGRIFEEDHHVVRNKYVIRDGKVCSAIAGPLGHIKRTRKSKKATALIMVPRTKIYKSLKEYAERGCYVPFNEKYQAYGYTYNPNGRWDWYEIGGRWPGTFLVKDDLGYIDADISESWKVSFPAPEGYIWVDAARKKDIAWDLMRQWHTEKVKSEYAELQAIFATGQDVPQRCLKVTEEGILHFGECIFHKDDTLEMHLSKFDISPVYKYPVNFADVIASDKWHDSYQFERKNPNDLEEAHRLWHRTQDDLIDALNDETVLVSVDYHT